VTVRSPPARIDLDLVRLSDDRFLAVVREFWMLDSMHAHSADDGATWSPIRPTGFKGANIKPHHLLSRDILCAYRDEDPGRPGVSEDGGARWRFIGQLYDGRVDSPGSPCSYPDVVALGDGMLLFVLHTYPDAGGQVDLHALRVRDRSRGD
jgi:hypothetical protein